MPDDTLYDEKLNNDLAKELKRVFTKLLEESEPLPANFQKILHENLWEILSNGK